LNDIFIAFLEQNHRISICTELLGIPFLCAKYTRDQCNRRVFFRKNISFWNARRNCRAQLVRVITVIVYNICICIIMTLLQDSDKSVKLWKVKKKKRVINFWKAIIQWAFKIEKRNVVGASTAWRVFGPTVLSRGKWVRNDKSMATFDYFGTVFS